MIQIGEQIPALEAEAFCGHEVKRVGLSDYQDRWRRGRDDARTGRGMAATVEVARRQRIAVAATAADYLLAAARSRGTAVADVELRVACGSAR